MSEPAPAEAEVDVEGEPAVLSDPVLTSLIGAGITLLTMTDCRGKHKRNVSWTNTELPTIMYEDADTSQDGSSSTRKPQVSLNFMPSFRLLIQSASARHP